MKKIGLDMGAARIGVAVSDSLGIAAHAYGVYERGDDSETVEYFVRLAGSEGADAFVLGLPVNMDGTEGKSAEAAREFGERLSAESGLPVFYEDERLTTVAAQRILLEADASRAKRKKVVDKIAACLILQQYLDRKG